MRSVITRNFNPIETGRAPIKYILPAILILFLLYSCSPPPLINGFDSNSWVEDHDGCKGDRGSLAQQIISSKDKLLGKTEDRIMNTLGKPDRNELYDRNQKFYIYYLDPGTECKLPASDPEMLIIRFSAVGICNEVFIQRGFSTR
jgi:outer membrane protein assembly factor BamE (lipoprotein component of BamABCDE complex)